ncbi:MAG: peptidoglycan-binding protein [bacterium]|nr:peptidoglycan-binding protein [bacterium]
MKKLAIFALSIFIIGSFFNVAQSAVNSFLPISLTKQMGQGSTGSSVITLQNFLVQYGYLTGMVDGKFGPKTKAAVIKYQKTNKISPTGFVGPLTFASINKAIASFVSSSSSYIGSTLNTSTTKTLSISTPSLLATGQVGVDYNVSIDAVGGGEGYSNWEVVSGSLPPGIILVVTSIKCIKAACYNWMPAYISGTPTETGSYSFTMQVVSGNEKFQKDFTLQITNPVLHVCEYAQPPTGFHYQNLKQYPPCGADLVPNQ